MKNRTETIKAQAEKMTDQEAAMKAAAAAMFAAGYEAGKRESKAGE